MDASKEYQFQIHSGSAMLDYELMAGTVLNGSKGNDPFGVIWGAFYDSEIMPTQSTISLKGIGALTLIISKMIFDHPEAKLKFELLQMYQSLWDNLDSDKVYALVSRMYTIAGTLEYYR
jgi:hypothetical protein